MCQGFVIPLLVGIFSLNEISHPEEVVVRSEGEAKFVGTLCHNCIARKAAPSSCSRFGIYHAVEAIVEGPINVTSGKPYSEHSISTVPSVCAGEKLIR